ncbi:hypothetical protein T4A_324 [Trichinella pseudospiralis]|uniref:Uncharacterized protein n=1 Tax=Trichinella pseudospiralis TaxID=6337 RepID=A0A0V1F200_TRIPS|nr:hypothetical protein T4A_324 [Trichinella pseudospiralis]
MLRSEKLSIIQFQNFRNVFSLLKLFQLLSLVISRVLRIDKLLQASRFTCSGNQVRKDHSCLSVIDLVNNFQETIVLFETSCIQPFVKSIIRLSQLRCSCDATNPTVEPDREVSWAEALLCNECCFGICKTGDCLLLYERSVANYAMPFVFCPLPFGKTVCRFGQLSEKDIWSSAFVFSLSISLYRDLTLYSSTKRFIGEAYVSATVDQSFRWYSTVS